jgi:hypothetical protein
LEFPVTASAGSGGESLGSLLSEEFGDAQSIGVGENSRAVKKVIEKYIRDNIGSIGSGGEVKSDEDKKSAIFAFSGVDLFDATVHRKSKRVDGSADRRYLRGALRWMQEKEEEVLEVTYTFTARGSYNVSKDICCLD